MRWKQLGTSSSRLEGDPSPDGSGATWSGWLAAPFTGLSMEPGSQRSLSTHLVNEVMGVRGTYQMSLSFLACQVKARLILRKVINGWEWMGHTTKHI